MRSNLHLLCCLVGPVILTVFCGLALKWLVPKKLSPVIQTAQGKIQGNVALSRDGFEYWQFLGVPFAKPPVGDLKYLPPEPPESWNGTKQTTTWSSECAQYDGFFKQKIMGELDCLYLNVFVSKRSHSKPAPVLVWIYGGAFYTGSAKMYHPEYLMDEEDVVVVSMNYRLGPLGFLNLEDPQHAPHGNVGLLDQLMALKWIQQNIAKFGGNPKQVTLLGESSGSMSINLHILSEMSTGLFQKAIMQSGYALSDWGFTKNSREFAKRFAKKVGCSVDSLEDVRKCYENTAWEKLVPFQECLMEPLIEKDLFGPSIDGQFLKGEPKELLKSGKFPDIPVMFGVNGAEGSLRTARFDAYPELIETLDKEWDNVVHNVIILDEPVDKRLSVPGKQKYFGKQEFSKDIPGFRRNFTKMANDWSFFLPFHNTAMAHAKRGAPTYLYYFNYTSKNIPSPYSAFRAYRKDDWLPTSLKIAGRMAFDWIGEYWLGNEGSRPFGITHGDDGHQVWNFEGVFKYISGSDREFSKEFIRTILNFARDEKSLKFGGVTWPAINEHLLQGNDEFSIPYMLMDSEKGKIIPEPFAESLKFWTEILQNEDIKR